MGRIPFRYADAHLTTAGSRRQALGAVLASTIGLLGAVAEDVAAKNLFRPRSSPQRSSPPSARWRWSLRLSAPRRLPHPRGAQLSITRGFSGSIKAC